MWFWTKSLQLSHLYEKNISAGSTDVQSKLAYSIFLPILPFQSRFTFIADFTTGGNYDDKTAEYLNREQVKEGYYVVFDYRSQKAQIRIEKEKIDAKTIFSYCIPVLQTKPSNLS